MQIQQWIYTSTCWGIERQNGFQIFSYSEGLSPTDSNEIFELIGGYDFPNSLEYDSYEQFPISFYHIKLSSGRWLLARTTPLGNGWVDGRPGNFIVHALVSDESFPGNPMSYYNSSVFWTDMPDDVKREGLRIRNDETPWHSYGYLPTLTERDCKPDASMSRDNLERWAQTNEYWGVLATLLESFQGSHEQKKTLTIRDDKDSLPKLLALLMYYIPNYISNSFTFCTYMDANYKLPELLKRYDLIGIQNGIADLDFRVKPKLILSPLLEVQKYYKNEFPQWCEKLHIPFELLPVAPNVFMFVNRDMGKLQLDKIGEVAEFLFLYDKEGNIIPKLVSGIIDNQETLLSDSSYKQIAPILIKCAKYFKNSKEYLQRLYSLFSDKLIRFVSLPCFKDLFHYTAQLCDAAFYVYWLSADNMNRIKEYTNKVSEPSQALTILESLWDAGGEYSSLHDQFPDVLSSLINNICLDLGALVKFMGRLTNPEIINIWHDAPLEDTSIIKAIAQVLHKREVQSATDIRQKMLDSKSYKRLWMEFQLQPDYSASDFIVYSNNIFSYNSEYKKLYFSEALKRVKFDNVKTNELTWFINVLQQLDDTKIVQDCLQKIERSLSLSRPDMEQYKNLMSIYKLQKTSDTISTFLLWSMSIFSMDSINGQFLDKGLQHWSKVFKTLTHEKKHQWTQWWLPLAFSLPNFTPGCHKAILEFLLKSDDSKNYLMWSKYYIQLLIQTIKEKQSDNSRNTNDSYCIHPVMIGLYDYTLTLLPDEFFDPVKNILVEAVFVNCTKEDSKRIEKEFEVISSGLSKTSRDKFLSRKESLYQTLGKSKGIIPMLVRYLKKYFN